MTDVMASLFGDFHPSIAKLTLFRDGNCFIIASKVSPYSLWQMLLRGVADGSTRSLGNTLYDRCISRFDIPSPVLGPQKDLLSHMLRFVAYNNTATHLTPPLEYFELKDN